MSQGNCTIDGHQKDYDGLDSEEAVLKLLRTGQRQNW